MQNRFTDEWAIVATIDPIDANNADSSTDIIDMSKYSEVVFICMLGVINASATFDFQAEESANSDGSSSALITGKAITQLTGAGSDGAKQVILSVKAEEMAASKRYLKGVMANSAHSQLAAVLALGRARFRPASDDDLASVDEIVS